MSRELQITVSEGGERLYVFPFSYYKSVISRTGNKVMYLDGTEKYPYHHDMMLDRSDSIGSFYRSCYSCCKPRRLWDVYIRRFLVGLARAWELNDYRNLCRHIKMAVPFVACKYPGIRISIMGQLKVADPNNYTHTCYLNPSDKYIKERIEEWLAIKGDALLSQRQKMYSDWAQCQANYRRTIGYIVSLDT